MDSLPRRSFLQTLAATGAATALAPLRAQDAKEGAPDKTLLTKTPPKIKIGLDNFAVRALGWKAAKLIEFAASLKCDSLLISDLDAYESLEDSHLAGVKEQAKQAGIELYAGSWSICPTSKAFK